PAGPRADRRLGRRGPARHPPGRRGRAPARIRAPALDRAVPAPPPHAAARIPLAAPAGGWVPAAGRSRGRGPPLVGSGADPLPRVVRRLGGADGSAARGSAALAAARPLAPPLA